MPYRTCKRCSVTRVNTLTDLYERAYGDHDKAAEKALKQLVKLATDRGYREGATLLEGGLDRAGARAICWNVSSLLTEEDMSRFASNSGQKKE